MACKTQRRDLFIEYLSQAKQAGSLIQQKQALSHVDQDLREMHRLLMQLGNDILMTDPSPGCQADYLAALQNVQGLIEQQALVDNLMCEFEAVQGQMEAIGTQLGWPPHQPEYSNPLSQLQSEIQGLRSMLA